MDIAFVVPYSELIWWAVALAALLAGIVVVLRSLEQRRGDRLARFVELDLATKLVSGHDAVFRRPLVWLTILGFFFAAIALAQPHWGSNWEEVERRSHDVLVCLDISESMLAENPLPNRLERAKQKILSILDETPGDRFGLVAFSGAAELMCPLTLDKAYFRSVLAAVNTQSISLEGTNIAAALHECIETYKDQEDLSVNARDQRSILLISDGEQVSGDAVAMAKSAGDLARVFVIGVGDPRGTEVRYVSPLNRPGVITPTMEPHISRLDEAMLSRIALQGRGAYIRSAPDNADVEEIYRLIDRMSTRRTSTDVRQRLVNRFQWPLALAVLCFAGEGLWLVMLPIFRVDDRGRGQQSAEGGDRV